MGHSAEDAGVAQVLMERLTHERLPRLLEIEARVDNGELLSDFDIEYLERALEDASHSRKYLLHLPEFSGIAGRVAQLYEHITSKALANERARK